MSPFDIWKIIGEKVIEVTEVERISRDIAKSLGCNGDTDHEILHCMRERPLSEIMSLYSVIIYCVFFNAYAYFTACVYFNHLSSFRTIPGIELCNRFLTIFYQNLNNSYQIQ